MSEAQWDFSITEIKLGEHKLSLENKVENVWHVSKTAEPLSIS